MDNASYHNKEDDKKTKQCDVKGRHPRLTRQDLSPIELVCGDIKGRVAEHFTGCMKEKKELCYKLFSEYPIAKWRKYCEHVYKIEDTYRQRECVIDEAVDKFIISVNNDSSSSDDDDGTQ
ncbi:hypothetical protein J6590_046274 [Homalodisca vitripennis]|nr:hypothetical protein J6590_046274 [Homalodisca vitripennis]